MAKQNICRAITLYSNFLPASKQEPRWDYCAFGMIDGIGIGENLIESSEQDLLTSIWHEQSTFCGKLSGEYTAQQIFVVRYGETEEERAFWDQEEYPFLLFCRMQCCGNRNFLWENRHDLEKALNFYNRVIAMVYLTYDNSDMVIVLRSRKYEDGAGIINAFHQHTNFFINGKRIGRLKNSFSIMAVKYDRLGKIEESATLNAHISIVERRIGGIKEIYRELLNRKEYFVNKDKVGCNRFSVLGSNDEEIVISNICWRDFLALYKREDGLFCFSAENKFLYENASCITTEIMAALEDYENDLKSNGIVFNDENGQDDDIESGAVQAYDTKVSELRSSLKKLKYTNENLRELRLIFNSLPKFSGKVFNDYTLFPVLGSLDVLLKLLQEDVSAQYFDKRGFFEFLNTFCLYVQNSMRSDRMSMQTLDFNVKMYDVPSKLIAFYSSYVTKICGILSKSDNPRCCYGFLTIPGMSSFINVRELFKRRSYSYRLIQIKIPEYNFYETKDVMIVLAHEVAHYVGRRYRHREGRYDAIISNYVHVYIKYIRHYAHKELPMKDIAEDTWKIIELRMVTILKNALEREKDAEFLQKFRIPQSDSEQRSKIVEASKQYAFHFANLCNNMELAVHDIIQYGLENVFGLLVHDENQEEKKDILNWLQDVSLRFMFRHQEGSTLLCSQETFRCLRMMYSECFADLIMNLLLKLNMEDYISSLIYNWRQQYTDSKKLAETEVLVRIALVLVVISRLDHEYVKYLYEKWKDEECREIAYKAFRFWVSATDSYENVMEDEGKLWINILGDKQILESMCNYLETCGKKFLEDNGESSEQINELRKCYNLYSEKNISAEEQIICVTEFVEEYKKEYLKSEKEG